MWEILLTGSWAEAIALIHRARFTGLVGSLNSSKYNKAIQDI